MATLRQNETTIAQAESSFVSKGLALAEIRDKAQFQKSSKTSESGETEMTFDHYLTDRWDSSRRHADRTIAAAKVAQVAEQLGLPLTNEGQAREVADLISEPELLEDVLRKAQPDSGRLTAARIRQVRRELTPVNDAAPATQPSEQSKDVPNEDPNQGEDWGEVLKAMRTATNRTIREMPADWADATVKVLEGCLETARKKAAKHRTSGKSGSK
jgi:hypothetical protein